MNRSLACLLSIVLLAGCLSNEPASSEAKTNGCSQGTQKEWPGTNSGTICVHQQYLLNGQWSAIEQDFAALKVSPPSSSGEDWVTAWQEASSGADSAYRSLQTRLRDLQTDSLGQPTWPELEHLEKQAAELKQHIDQPYQAHLSDTYAGQASDLRNERLASIAQALPAFLAGALLATGIAFAVALRWKKRTEYYRPYASKRVFAAPELVLAIVGFSVLMASLVAAAILGLPAVLRSLMVIGGF